MFKRLSQFLCIVTFIIGDWAYALTCSPPVPERIVTNYDTIFVALISKGYFVEGDGPRDCGRIDGSFEVIESLKGNPESVSVIRKNLHNCQNVSIGGASDNFPLGKYILVATNREVVNVSDCTTRWDDPEPSCLIYNIRHLLNIDMGNDEVPEWCIRNREPRSKLSRIEALRMEIADLENESEFLDMEILELKGKLSEAELSKSPE